MISAALLACAVNVAPVTMDKIVHVEFRGDLLAIHVNRLTGPQPHASTVQEAVAIANHFIAAGYTVDLGMVQLNSANLGRFGYTVMDAFDGCKNIAAGAAVLSAFYGKAVQRFGEGQQALAAALSGYNTGDLQRGFDNGYVGKYYISTTPARPAGKSTPPAEPAFTTVAYDRPGLDLHIN